MQGVAFQKSEAWKANRKFFTTALKERLFKSQNLPPSSLYDSIADFLRDNNKDRPVNVVELLMRKCNCNLRRTLFDESVSEEVIREISTHFGAVMHWAAPNCLPTGNVARY